MSSTPLTQVKNKVEQTKAIVGENIEKAVENIENTAILSEQVEDLQEGANQFNATAKVAKRLECWKDAKVRCRR